MPLLFIIIIIISHETPPYYVVRICIYLRLYLHYLLLCLMFVVGGNV